MLRHYVFFEFPMIHHATTHINSLHFHTYVMLRHWMFSCTGRLWAKWLLEKTTPTFHTGKQIRHWKKNKNLHFDFFCSWNLLFVQHVQVLELNYAVCMVFKAFWPWIPCSHRACSILEQASVLCRGLSAAFRVICNILSRVSAWIYFRLVRVYLGDQRMRR